MWRFALVVSLAVALHCTVVNATEESNTTAGIQGASNQMQEPAGQTEHVFTYPVGVGPVLMNECTQDNYNTTSPCYPSKLVDLDICRNIMDPANYIGVGFDGRGYYDAQSRRASLVQRKCAKSRKFMNMDVPDAMNVLGIYDTTAETKFFQSVDEYMEFIRQKAGLSNQRNLFSSEASRFSMTTGRSLCVGGAIGSGTSSGSASGSSSGSSSLTVSGRKFIATMFVNIILYEITLDEVKSGDISMAALKDFMALPASYYSLGGDVKYQNFLLRWGTHFVRSAKIGGQLKITKTTKSSSVKSAEEVSTAAKSEFKSMFATLQSINAQSLSSSPPIRINSTEAKASPTSRAIANSTQRFLESEFTQTSLEAQGGSPEIAGSLVDLHSPDFKQIYQDWLASIKDNAKPVEFQLKAIDEIFNMNMDDLFPAGETDFGCVGSSKASGVKIMVDAETNRRYYTDVRTITAGERIVQTPFKVFCKYNHLNDFKADLVRRRTSLKRAINVYMIEGPFPTSSFELEAGEAGCEEATLSGLRPSGTGSQAPTYAEMKKQPFLIEFDLPQPVPGLISAKAKFRIVYRGDMWFGTEPTQQVMHLYEGCNTGIIAQDAKICFRNIILTYNEDVGFLRVDREDFATAKSKIPSLPDWLSGLTVARVEKLENLSDVSSEVSQGRIAVPCRVQWMNSHRMDPNKEENCIHFTAESDGDLFVIFSSIPRDHTTWYYLQINSEGVSYYHAMKLQMRDVQKGMGILGDKNLVQSFFVCVVQKADRVIMQYGKDVPDGDVGAVYSGFAFAPDSQFSRLSFYSFGSGSKSVSLMDIRLSNAMPIVKCLNNNYVKKDGYCLLDCHDECDGCKKAKDNRACLQCKHVRVETGSENSRVTECLPFCPLGQHESKTMDRLCLPCPAGLHRNVGRNLHCSLCPSGTFSSVGDSNCTSCSAGTYNGQSGQSSCTECPTGTHASSSGAEECKPCKAGHFASTGQAECSKCLLGHYGNGSGLSSCMPCARGYFAENTGQTKCDRCPAGTFSSSVGASQCTQCPAGTFSAREGATTSSSCLPCDAGTFAAKPGSVSCGQCQVGHYQSLTGQTSCNRTSAGQYADQMGLKAPKICPGGTFSSSAAVTQCTQCPAGKYASGSGNTACRDCLTDTIAPRAGMSECEACTEYTPTPGSSACVCPSNIAARWNKVGCPASNEELKMEHCLQSSNYYSNYYFIILLNVYYGCNLAIDGNTDQNWGANSCSETLSIPSPSWWEGSVKDMAFIKEVQVYNRQDAVPERLNNFVIKVDGHECASYKSDKSFSVKTFVCNRAGSVLRIESRLQQPLNLCEVKAFGEPFLRIPLSSCRQSSDYQGLVKPLSCDKAIDGNYDWEWYNQSCTQTLEEERPFWEASAGKNTRFGKVRIVNRVDFRNDLYTPSDRLSNFVIKLDGHECASFNGEPFSVKTFDCNRDGKTLRIESQKRTSLTLCEVVAYLG